MLQLVLTGVLYLILVIPVGRYLYHIAAGKHTFADPVLDRIDDVIYKIVGVDPHRGMNWRQYALALIGTNAVMIAIGYRKFPTCWVYIMFTPISDSRPGRISTSWRW